MLEVRTVHLCSLSGGIPFGCADTDFKQQRLKAWRPILTPTRVVAIYAITGLVFVIVGIIVQQGSKDVVEYRVQYDGDGMSTDCSVKSATEPEECTLTVKLDKPMKGPIYVYYQLTNFYQNHRDYVKSVSQYQMRGECLKQDSPANMDLCSSRFSVKDCEPRHLSPEGAFLMPCGSIANSLFTDTFKLLPVSTAAGTSGQQQNVTMSESGITWDTDLSYKFKNLKVTTDNCKIVSGNLLCDEKLAYPNALTCAPSPHTKNGIDPQNCTCFNKDGVKIDASNCVKYLWQSYPDVIPKYPYQPEFGGVPEFGVQNEHFILWVRTAGLPSFRKLYGIIHQDIASGVELKFKVKASFEVKSFSGTKTLVLSTKSWLGGKNEFLGAAYIVVGSICLVLGLFFKVKSAMFPRELGDPNVLGLQKKRV